MTRTQNLLLRRQTRYPITPVTQILHMRTLLQYNVHAMDIIYDDIYTYMAVSIRGSMALFRGK